MAGRTTGRAGSIINFKFFNDLGVVEWPNHHDGGSNANYQTSEVISLCTNIIAISMGWRDTGSGTPEHNSGKTIGQILVKSAEKSSLQTVCWR